MPQIKTSILQSKTTMKQKISKLHLSNIRSAQKPYNHTITKTSDTVQHIHLKRKHFVLANITQQKNINTHIFKTISLDIIFHSYL